MKRFILIVRGSGVGKEYLLWSDVVKKWAPNDVFVDGVSILGRVCNLSDAKVHLIREPSNASKFAKWVNDTLESDATGDDWYVAAHASGTYSDLIWPRGNKKTFIAELRHKEETCPYDAVRAFVSEPSVETLPQLCDAVTRGDRESLLLKLTPLVENLTKLVLVLLPHIKRLADSGFPATDCEEVAKLFAADKAKNDIRIARNIVYDREGQGSNIQRVIEHVAPLVIPGLRT